jgi:hypothetical protein
MKNLYGGTSFHTLCLEFVVLAYLAEKAQGSNLACLR